MLDFDKLVKMVKDFPTLPTIYSKVMKTMADPKCTVNDLADIIQSDQSITLKILKFANSPMLGMRTKVENISDAIFYVGFKEIKNIILALSVMKLFAKFKSGSALDIVKLWEHSIAVGAVTRILGSQVGVKNVEDYYISGILHDVGKLFFIKIFKEKYAKIIEEAVVRKISLNAVEKEIFGKDHCFVGYLLADSWKLPKSIVNCIRYHEKGVSASGEFAKQIACVHLANIIAQAMELGESGDEIVDEPNFEIWSILAIKPGQIAGLYDTFLSHYQKSTSILALDG